MEVMNVPQSRSRISLAPSMVGGGTKKGMMRKSARRAYEGEGMFDVVKSVGQAVAPAIIDLASDYAKGKLGGMALPLKVSPAQKRTLKKGGAITIKPDMIMEDAKQALAMLPATAKKVLGSLSKNNGIRVALKQGEDVIDRMTGKGLFDVAKSVGKAVAPVIIDLASQEAKRRVSGEGLFDVAKSVGKAVAPVIIDLASQEAKRRVSGGSMRRVRIMNGCGGSPYVSAPYKQVMDLGLTENGGSIFPAGGGIYPAGKYGSGYFDYPVGRYGSDGRYKKGSGIPYVPYIDGRFGKIESGSGIPIQLGSPYINTNSPAMHPFIQTRSIQSYDPIGKSGKQGCGPIGSVVGQLLGNMLPI